ncbi:MAG: ribosome assembly factor SBDS [Thermoplasmata archaeon]
MVTVGKKDYQKEHTDTVLDEYVIARFRSKGENFEILIKPEAVESFRGGRDIDMLENMPVDKIFSDAKKGEEVSTDVLKDIFETTDVEKVAEEILDRGDVQITTEQRRKRQEQKRKEIVNRIVRNSMNPQTGTPHPPNRIENAMNEAQVHIDPFKPVSMQMDEVVDRIRGLIPLSFNKLEMSVKVRGDLYGKLYGELKSMGTIVKEDWLQDGSWEGVVKIPAGVKDEFFERINHITKGQAQIEVKE